MSMPGRRRVSRATQDEDLAAISALGAAAEPERAELVSMDVLIHALQQAGISNKREHFRAPTYVGEGDIELFLKQFDDVAIANGWTDDQQTLHLRAQLLGPAQSCGRGRTKDEIVEDLRARFGLTGRQAKERLSMLRRGARQSLHDLCAEITMLVGLGFSVLPPVDQDSLTLDYFLQAVDNKALNRHMLAIKPKTPREAVVAAEEFFGCDRGMPSQRAMPVEMEEKANQVRDPLRESLTSFSNILQSQSTLLAKLLTHLESGGATGRGPPSGARKVECFECGGPHYKRNCPNSRGPQRTFGGSNNRGSGPQKSGQGNANGPAQV